MSAHKRRQTELIKRIDRMLYEYNQSWGAKSQYLYRDIGEARVKLISLRQIVLPYL